MVAAVVVVVVAKGRRRLDPRVRFVDELSSEVSRASCCCGDRCRAAARAEFLT